MTEGGDIFTPTTPEAIHRQAELLALRQMGASLAALTDEMVAHRGTMSDIKTDVALIKERQRVHGEIKDTVEKLATRLDAIETRNTKQDGAVSLVQFFKDFGPWIVSLVILAWSFLSRRPL